LGRTSFSPANATAKDGILTFKIPGNTFESSELQSVNFMGYGSYEIRMKIPDAPGSITGFFMYKAPDYYHEIDIEIYNQKSGDYFLTTYADGDKRKESLELLLLIQPQILIITDLIIIQINLITI
jgi:beta-glucanase (GH16 family)